MPARLVGPNTIWLRICAARGSLAPKRVEVLLPAEERAVEVSAMKNYTPEKILLGLIGIELILIALFGLFGVPSGLDSIGPQRRYMAW